MKIKKKEKIESFKLIKSLCAIGIIIFHFSCHYNNSTFRPLYTFANGGWGQVFVPIFFMISGALLYYNYNDSLKIKEFYKKRWLSIFPMFYLAYISFEIGNMIANKSVLFRGSILPYIYTLLGMDGYLSENTITYYILGEWFLGMIIFLYLLFPLIRYLFNKSDKLTVGLISILYLFFINTPIINPNPQRSIITCLFSFVLGMFIIKYRSKVLNKYTLLISIISSLIILLFKLPIHSDICSHLLVVSLLIIMMISGEKIMKNRIINLVFTDLSSISYAMFLLHHLVIFKLLRAWYPSSSKQAFYLLVSIIVLTLVESKILTVVNNEVVKKVFDIKNIKKSKG